MFPVSRAAVLAAVVAAGLSPALARAQEGPPVPTLSITATGTVPSTPDTAVITVGVTTQAETADAALSDNNARMRKLIDEVLASGVADRDVATSDFRIEPRMVYPPQREDGTQDPPKITGYQIDNTVTVRIRDLAKAGDLLDTVVRLGANQVQGVNFIVDDDRRLLDKARVEAVKAADAKAAIYAEAGGFRLKRILAIREEAHDPVFPGPMATRMKAQADSVPLASGGQDVSITISVDWEIEPR